MTLGVAPLSTLPLSTQADAAGAVSATLAIDTGTYAITTVDATFIVSQVLAVDSGSYVVTFNDATFAAVGVVPATQPGPADDRPARRRRDRQISEAYWAQRQREALEEQERKRLEALAEAEAALEDAENAKKADAKRKAVRRVFDALKRAATTDKARSDAQVAEAAALEAIRKRETEAQRAVYLEALDALNAEIEAIGVQITKLYARRRQEEEFLLRMWAA